MAEAIACLGLAFGDEGKGSLIDAMARRHRARLVVRFNGGAQAGHNVVDGDRHHCFAQWGSGTFAGAATHLSRFMMVNPIFALAESKRLVLAGISDPFSMMTIERGALVTTPFHVSANRLREIDRGDGRHGSCGMGIGETMGDSLYGEPDVIRVGDSFGVMLEKLVSIQARKRKRESLGAMDRSLTPDWDVLCDESEPATVARCFARFFERVRIVEPEWLHDQLRAPGTVLFEGAQGALLDQDHGDHPHTTWSDCTFGNVDRLLEGSGLVARRIGVLRAYHTRHGAGPFPSECPDFDALSSDDHNATGPWQGRFRSGMLDTGLIERARNIVGHVDGVALTRIDRLPPAFDIYSDGHVIPSTVEDVEYAVRRNTMAPIVVRSYGMTHGHKTFCEDAPA